MKKDIRDYFFIMVVSAICAMFGYFYGRLSAPVKAVILKHTEYSDTLRPPVFSLECIPPCEFPKDSIYFKEWR